VTHARCMFTSCRRDASTDSEVLMGGWKVESLAGIERQPEHGVYCHSSFMEGARWDVALNSVKDSFP